MNCEIWEFVMGGRHRVIRTWFEDENVNAEDRAKLDVD
jgi:hypothetical protein